MYDVYFGRARILAENFCTVQLFRTAVYQRDEGGPRALQEGRGPRAQQQGRALKRQEKHKRTGGVVR